MDTIEAAVGEAGSLPQTAVTSSMAPWQEKSRNLRAHAEAGHCEDGQRCFFHCSVAGRPWGGLSLLPENPQPSNPRQLCTWSHQTGTGTVPGFPTLENSAE